MSSCNIPEGKGALKEKLNYYFCSFKYALRGISYAWKNEKNFRLEVFIGLFVLLLALVFPLRLIDQMLLGILVVGVLALELINTALERLMDVIKPGIHPYIQIAKDVVAGAVLLAAGGSAVIGLILFYPHFKDSLFYIVDLLSFL